MNRRFAKFGIATVVALGLASGAFAQADNSNSLVAPATSFPGWMTDYSKSNQGRISRDAYMQESARRWDAMDQERRGLTVDEVTRLYGYPSGGPMPRPKDNMTSPASPANVKK
jgi:hypothetical protein